MTPPQETVYPELPQTKVCSTCKIMQPTTSFCKQIARKDGLTSQCKDCRRKNAIKRIENIQDRCIDENSLKICRTCKTQKTLTAFHKKKSSLDGRHPICKECRCPKKPKKPLIALTHKTCSKCKVLKPIAEFCKRGNNPSKFRSHCNSCRHAEGKAEYKRRRDTERERHREYRIKNRESILAREAELRKINRNQIKATRKRWEANNPDKMMAKRDRFKEKYPHYVRDRNRKQRAENPELIQKEASDGHFKKMGVDQDWYDRTLAAQGYGCMICGRPDSGVPGKRFFIDHDHKCCGNTKACEKCRRGLLCLQCNTWISGIEKYPRLARRALWYLNKFTKTNNENLFQYSLFSA